MANVKITKEGKALLDGIVGSESNGRYNQINGGATFNDYSKHPKGTTANYGYGLAAGKYQFMPGTWGDLQRKYGYSDFSPASQDDAAWQLAQDRYRAKTGDDLQGTLEAGRYLDAGRALNGVWTSLPGGAEENSQTKGFLARVNASLAGKGKVVAEPSASSSVPSWVSEGSAVEDAKAPLIEGGDSGFTGWFIRIAVGLAGMAIMTVGLVKFKV